MVTSKELRSWAAQMRQWAAKMDDARTADLTNNLAEEMKCLANHKDVSERQFV
jgi:hypothetical protein